MKILKIEFENINSYKGHYCIDFTDEAYKKYYNQFVISGPTAAGKTTILDVITLALYGSTPRQARLTKTNNEVMNRESGYCMASLTYSCDEGIFCSTFRQNRANNKKDGNLQNPTCTVENVETGQKAEFETTGKLIEVTEANIHLTYDQFVRSILIPQGSFDKFLKSEDEEKAEILAKVSRTEHFKDIAACLWAEWNEVTTAYKNQQDRKDEVKVMTDEEEEKVKGEKAGLEKKSDEIKDEAEKLKKALEWRKKADEAETSLSQAESLLNHAKIAESEFAPKKEVLRKAEKAGRCQESYAALVSLEKNLNAEVKNIADAESEIIKIGKRLAEAKKKAEAAGAVQQKYQEEEGNLKELWKKVRELDTKLQTEKKLLNQRQTDYNTAKETLEAKKGTFQTLSDRIAALTDQNTEHSAYLSEHEKDSEIDSVLSWLREKKKNLDRVVGSKQGAEKEKSKKEREKEQKSTECEQLGRREEELKGQLFDLVDQNHVVIAGILRGKLETGKPCPVCGREYQPFEMCHEEQSGDSARVAADVSKISDELEKVKEKHQEVKDTLTGLEKDIADEQRKYDAAEQEEKEILSELNECLRPWEMELTQDASGYDNTFRVITTSLEKRKDDYNGRAEALKSGEQELGEAKAKKDGLDIDQAEKEVAGKEKLFAEQKRACEAIAAERYESFGEKKVDAEENGFYAKLKAQTDAVNAAEKEKVKINEELVEKNTLKTDAVNRKADLEPKINEAERLFRDALQKNGFDSVDEFLGCKKEEAEIESLKQEEKQIEDKKKEAETTWKNAGEKLEDIQKEKCTDKSAGELEQEQSQVETETEETNKRIVEIKMLLSNNDEAKKKVADIDRELERLAKEKENYDVIKDMIGKKDGSAFQVFVQKIAMQNLIIKANEFMETLQPDKRLYAEEDSMDIMIREGEGDEMVTRPISNASGGETFCISLAMALAMAEFASENGGVDALFLDEGFGTLSGDPLMEAISSLKMLRKTGKLLGIITHVDTVIKEFDIELKAKKTGRRSTMTGPGVSFISETGEKKKTGIRKKG